MTIYNSNIIKFIKEHFIEILTSFFILLLSISFFFTYRSCSQIINSGQARQAIVDAGKEIKSIIDDIKKGEN